MPVPRFPIRIRESKTIGIRTTRPLAGLEAIKPWLERRLRIAAIVAGLNRTNKSRRQNAEGEGEGRSFHHPIRTLIKIPNVQLVLRVDMTILSKSSLLALMNINLHSRISV